MQQKLLAKVSTNNKLQPISVRDIIEQALPWAASFNDIATVKYLINEQHVPVNTKDKITGKTALHCAVSSSSGDIDNDELVKFLILKNADVTIRDNNNKTPEDYANNKLEIKKLLEHKVILKASSSSSSSSLVSNPLKKTNQTMFSLASGKQFNIAQKVKDLLDAIDKNSPRSAESAEQALKQILASNFYINNIITIKGKATTKDKANTIFGHLFEKIIYFVEERKKSLPKGVLIPKEQIQAPAWMVEIIKTMLARDDINVDLHLSDGLPLLIAFSKYLFTFPDELFTLITDKTSIKFINTAKGGAGQAPLLVALCVNLNNICYQKFEGFIQHLLERKGILVDVSDNNHCTALHFIGMHGASTSLLELFLKLKPNFNAVAEGLTPYQYAVISSTEHKDNQRIKNALDFFAKHVSGNQIDQGEQMTKELLTIFPDNSSAQQVLQQKLEGQLNPNGLTKLFNEAHPLSELSDLLTKHPLKPDQKVRLTGTEEYLYPLELILWRITAFIVENFSQNNRGLMVSDEMIFAITLNQLKLLLKYGADPCKCKSSGNLLHYVVILGDAGLNLARPLIEKGLDPHAFDNRNVSPFMVAISSRSIKLTKLFLDKKTPKEELWKTYSLQLPDYNIWQAIEESIANDDSIDILNKFIELDILHSPIAIFCAAAEQAQLQILKRIYPLLAKDQFTPIIIPGCDQTVAALSEALFLNIISVKHRNKKVMEFLLQIGANPQLIFQVKNQITNSFTKAVYLGDDQLIKLFLDHATDKLIQPANREKFLFDAICESQPLMLEAALNIEPKWPTNKKILEGLDLLKLAISNYFILVYKKKCTNQELIQKAKGIIRFLLTYGFQLSADFKIDTIDQDLREIFEPKKTDSSLSSSSSPKTSTVDTSKSKESTRSPSPSFFSSPSLSSSTSTSSSEPSHSSRRYLKEAHSILNNEFNAMKTYRDSHDVKNDDQSKSKGNTTVTTDPQQGHVVSWFGKLTTEMIKVVKPLGQNRYLFVDYKTLQQQDVLTSEALKKIDEAKDVNFGYKQLKKLVGKYFAKIVVDNVTHVAIISHEWIIPSSKRRAYILKLKPKTTDGKLVASDGRSTLYIAALADESGLHSTGDIKSFRASIGHKTFRITLPPPNQIQNNDSSSSTLQLNTH